MRLASKLTINENSTIFVQSWPNFHKLTSSFMGTFGKVSPKLNKNWRLFIKSHFWGQFHFLWISIFKSVWSISSIHNEATKFGNTVKGYKAYTKLIDLIWKLEIVKTTSSIYFVHHAIIFFTIFIWLSGEKWADLSFPLIIKNL